MRSLKKRRRIQVLALAAVSLALATGLSVWALRGSMIYARTPTQLLEAPPEPDRTINLLGLVKVGSVVPGTGVAFSFVVTDQSREVPVDYVGSDPKPDLFGEDQGTVVTGHWVDGRFRATKLLAKHDESYMPAEVVDALKEQGVFVEPNPGESTD